MVAYYDEALRVFHTQGRREVPLDAHNAHLRVVRKDALTLSSGALK